MRQNTLFAIFIAVFAAELLFLMLGATLSAASTPIGPASDTTPPGPPCPLTFHQVDTDPACASGSFVIFTRLDEPVPPLPADVEGCRFEDLGYWVQVYDGHTDTWYDFGRRWSGHVPCGWVFHHWEDCRTCGKYLGECQIICWPE
jgi:hypothetical protein